ncbi:replication/maintenance protein RepL [Streptomyces alkaliphilus]|uniref:replication/maintenance protein RepL n=1 Tax=Streptomyces alkaliphilus TaxID=1472722 RepID=UPI001567B8CC|nr:replication/maintenance protein RepL [Streptomyces alkaliphilus]
MPRQSKRPTAGRGKGRIAAVPPGGDGAFHETLSSRLGKDITPPTRKRPVQQMDVNVRYTYRAPHEMYGRSGYSVVSNDFLADVLAVLIAQHGMSPIQSAVLLWCIGRQREGWLRATHKKIADKLGVERSNVTRALGRLESWHMLQRVETGLIFVNPLLGFEGNGDRQQEVLHALRQGAPEGAFPELKAPPAPRSVQLELGAEAGKDEGVETEERAC